ncbi:MAG: membrane protein insertion efficiency factor YidD [Chitinispirillaceae bacterium]|nr:membrane protein insertion efficiency factor YidD [Chitinispirillaceae bacterium]
MVIARLLNIAFLAGFAACQVIVGQALSDEDLSDISLLCALHQAAPDTEPVREGFFPPEREVSLLGLTFCCAIRLYQNLISSQQHNICVFTPSCSHFGMESIRQCGFVKGILLTSDRLQRCSQFASQYSYRLDTATGRFHDPLKRYCSDTAAGGAADEVRP